MIRTSPIHVAAEAALRSAVGAISGCVVGDIAAKRPFAGGASVIMSVKGWSPSLHHVSMRWDLSGPLPAETDDQITTLLWRAEPLLAIQRQRLVEGLELGTAEPLRLSDKYGTIIAGREDHILLDEGLARLLARDDVSHMRRDVGDALFVLNDPQGGRPDGTETGYHGDITPDHGDEPVGHHGLEGCTVFHDVTLAHGLVYDGRMLTYEGSMPPTMVAAAVGRTLGDIANVPGEIANRIILDVEEGNGKVRFLIQPFLVRLAEIEAVLKEEGQR